MVARINLLRNVGRFDNVDAGRHLAFEKLTVIYAENGRGKTTIAAVLRSLATGAATDIVDRKRLGAPADPHVVVALDRGATATFQAGAWSATDPRLAIFDDEFVAKNVCQGIAVDASQREALHELIIGAQGVTLSNAVQVHVDRVEEHSRELRTRSAAIPAAARGTLTVDAFCKLQPRPDVDTAIATVEARLAAARSAGEIANAASLPSLSLPAFDTAALGALLARKLDDLDATAAGQVQAHAHKLGQGGERWIGDGVAYAGRPAAAGDDSCPFCAQDLGGSEMVEHYRAYFRQGYGQLKQTIADAIAASRRTHAGDVRAAFERRVREAVEARAFWQRFTPIPELGLDTVAVARAWRAAADQVDTLLQRKQAAPLEPVLVPQEAVDALAQYGQAVDRVRALDQLLTETNEAVARVKAEAGVTQVATLERELAELHTLKARSEPSVAAACQAYLDETAAKKVTETARDQARAALQTYREAVFPQYRTRVNDYLRRFNAGFHIGTMQPVNHRGGSAADYNFVVNGNNVGLGSFRTTLSAGDRNTLALAFFFATLDADLGLADRIVVVDDPMTSLDEHRTLHTVQELHGFAGRVRKVVVLSHSKPFLFQLWVKCSRLALRAIEVRRAGQGSTLVDWNVSEAMTDEVDRLHERTRTYLANGGDDDEMRIVAAGLRHILERFARVSYPESWGADMMLGAFHHLAVRHLGGPDQIFGPNDTAELRQLLDYTNRYHHDSNPGGYQTEAVSDAELADFARRTLAFATRRPH